MTRRGQRYDSRRCLPSVGSSERLEPGLWRLPHVTFKVMKTIKNQKTMRINRVKTRLIQVLEIFVEFVLLLQKLIFSFAIVSYWPYVVRLPSANVVLLTITASRQNPIRSSFRAKAKHSVLKYSIMCSGYVHCSWSGSHINGSYQCEYISSFADY
jgi:hypothetical protein